MNQKANTESLTDKPMSRDYIEQNNIIERYVLNQLSTEEMDAFEDQFTFDAELYEQVVITEKLIQGLKAVADDQEPSNHSSNIASLAAITASSSSPTAKWLPTNIAIAACLLLSISTAALLIQNKKLNGNITDMGNQVGMPIIHLELTRSSNLEPPKMATGTGLITILIDRGSIDPNTEYILQLVSEQSKEVLRSMPFLPKTSSPLIEWTINRDILNPGVFYVNLLNTKEQVSNQRKLTFSIYQN